MVELIVLIFAAICLVFEVFEVFEADLAEAIELTLSIEEKVADVTVVIKDALVAKWKDRFAMIKIEKAGFS